MEDADFNREFIDHMAVYMGDFLNYEGTWKVWEPMYNQIKTEYPYHRKLYNEWWPNYQDEMDKVKTWLKKRTNFMYQHLADYYKLGSPLPFLVNVTLDEAREVVLEGKPGNGKKVTGWNVIEDGIARQVEGSKYAFTMPSSSLQVNAIIGTDTGINDVESPVWTWQYANDIFTVNDITAGTRVSLYDISGMLISQQTANGSQLQFAVPANRIYILKVGDKTIKIQ